MRKSGMLIDHRFLCDQRVRYFLKRHRGSAADYDDRDKIRSILSLSTASNLETPFE
jgi:hypothetical protein